MRKLGQQIGELTANTRMAPMIVARGSSIPPPVEGWDAISPIAAMSPKRAVKLINFFPQTSWVEPRKGFRVHCNTGTDRPVETIAAYHGLSSDKLFAASEDTIFDVTGANASAEVTSLSNARFQYINFATTGGNFLFMVNGADDPPYYDGSSWSTATINGDIDGDQIVYVCAHKNRLWFATNNSSDAAYLAVDSIQGSATAFPLGGLFTLGGYLMAIGTWSVDGGTGPEDYIVFYSSRGQIAIYRGSDPSDAANFSLVGVFDMGAPLGRRCMTKVGADIALIGIDGVVPLSRAMIFERAAVQKVTLTQNIQRVMNQSARDYKNNFGWQLISYPRGTRAILNVPVSENLEQEQYVMNTITGAWCQFTGMNANCWEVFLDDPYFGGNEGIVYLADTGSTDFNQTFTADMMTAFNYFNSRGTQKRWTMCRPLLTTDQAINPGIAFNTDFQDNAPIYYQSQELTPSGQWDSAKWDQDIWGGAVQTRANWASVAGLGYCASIRVVISVDYPTNAAAWGVGRWGIARWGNVGAENITLQVNGFDVTMEQGTAFI
jgi:hypothetical protein